MIWATDRPVFGCEHIVVSPTKDLEFPEGLAQEDCPELHQYSLRDDGYHLVKKN